MYFVDTGVNASQFYNLSNKKDWRMYVQYMGEMTMRHSLFAGEHGNNEFSNHRHCIQNGIQCSDNLSTKNPHFHLRPKAGKECLSFWLSTCV